MSGSPKHAPQPRGGYDRSFDALAAQASPSHVPVGDTYDPLASSMSRESIAHASAHAPPMPDASARIEAILRTPPEEPRPAPEATPGVATVALEMAARALERRRVTVEAWVDDDGALHVSIAGDRIAELVVDGPTPSATLTVDV